MGHLYWQQVTRGWNRNAVYLQDVFIGGLALHKGRDVSDGPVHLYGNHFDGDGHGAPRQDGRVDDLGVLWRRRRRGGGREEEIFMRQRDAQSYCALFLHQQ